MMKKIIMTTLAVWLLVCFSILAIMIPFVGYAALFFALSFLISIVSLLALSVNQYIIANIALFVIMAIDYLVFPFYQPEELFLLIMWIPCSLLLIPLIRAQKSRAKERKYDILLFAVSLTPGILVTLVNVIKATHI